MDSNYQKAFVIHSRPYKETSLIVTFLSEKNGKINAVAKGAKRKNSKLSGNLEPFQCLNLASIKIVFLTSKMKNLLKPY
jgi:DNA repair protein RecO